MKEGRGENEGEKGRKEGRRREGGRKEGRKMKEERRKMKEKEGGEGGKEGRNKGRKEENEGEGRRGGREGRKEQRKEDEGRKEDKGRKEGRKEGRRRKEGRKEGTYFVKDTEQLAAAQRGPQQGRDNRRPKHASDRCRVIERQYAAEDTRRVLRSRVWVRHVGFGTGQYLNRGGIQGDGPVPRNDTVDFAADDLRDIVIRENENAGQRSNQAREAEGNRMVIIMLNLRMAPRPSLKKRHIENALRFGIRKQSFLCGYQKQISKSQRGRPSKTGMLNTTCF
jgi:hypothetical protein